MLESIKIIQWFNENNKIQEYGTLVFGTFNILVYMEVPWIPTGD